MRLQRDSYAPKSCAFDAANVQFLRAHLCKSHPVLQHRLRLSESGTLRPIYIGMLNIAINWLHRADKREA